ARASGIRSQIEVNSSCAVIRWLVCIERPYVADDISTPQLPDPGEGSRPMWEGFHHDRPALRDMLEPRDDVVGFPHLTFTRPAPLQAEMRAAGSGRAACAA